MIIDLNKEKMSLYEALFIAHENDVIILEDKVYFEKIKITTSNLTIIGTNNSTIEYDDYHARIIPQNLGGDGIKKYGTTGSATFTVKEEAVNFKAEGITFKNSHKRTIGINGGQAVAFKSESSGLRIKNCKFISDQDTLYVDSGL